MFRKIRKIYNMALSRGAANFPSYVGRDYENYFEQVRENYRNLCNGFDYYKAFADPLASDDKLKILPLYEMAVSKPQDEKILGIRHDIDADPVVGLRLARHLARHGICGSFYFLHSAIYYGEFHEGVFVRNPSLVEWLKGYMVTGCEVGLHNDAIGICYNEGLNPSALITSELRWLREQGVVVRGTVAHNTYEAIGAENYEVYEERLIWKRPFVAKNGKQFALGSCRMANLDLSYEGTFAKPRKMIVHSDIEYYLSMPGDVNNEQWMRRYLIDNPYCIWDIDYQVWITGRGQWVIAGGENRKDVFLWNTNLDTVHRFLSEIPRGTRTMVVLHPEYFGEYA